MNGDDKRELTRGYINLKEHLEALWIEREKRLEDRFTANTKTLEATAKELDRRLTVLNHAHEQSLDDRAEFLRITEYKNKIKDYDGAIKAVGDSVLKMETRYEGRIGVATWVSILALLVSVFAVVMRFIK